MTLETLGSTAPRIHVRWFHQGPAFLLSTAPVLANSNTKWQPFTRKESDACESAWAQLPEEEQRQIERVGLAGMKDSKPAENVAELVKEELSIEAAEEDDNEAEDPVGVLVQTDRLFEVDVQKMQLHSVFWQWAGPAIEVKRVLWFYGENKPVEPPLSLKLEDAFRAIKPWQSSYHEELETALNLGVDALEKLKSPLPDSGHTIIFQDASCARLFTSDISHKLMTTLFSYDPKTHLSGAPAVYRGYDEVVRLKGHKAKEAVPKDPSQSTAFQPAIVASDSKDRRAAERLDKPSVAGSSEASDDVTDLILVVHGIGQGMTAQYESFNFVYATNMLRQIAREQAASPALSSIMRKNRVQFLPVQWRSTLKVDQDEERERELEGLTNRFTMDDITPKNTIPLVRELTNNVLLDIPLFMSDHRQRMIESVCIQANRTYRLWCARNPAFEKTGRVHIIAHSLGSALASHILSKQPTTQQSLSAIGKEEVKKMRDSFLFDTSNLFLIGSPLSIFLHLNQTQLIARKGRERTMHSPPDEAMERTGTLGCLAVDSIYNIFNPADPVAYLLNPCVDSRHAKEHPPSAIPNASLMLFDGISTRVSKIFEGISISNPFSASPKGSAPISSHTGTDEGGEEQMLELNTNADETLVGSKAERRFAALNPHGTLDFYLPSEGNISGYVDMITAHSNYWTDPSLAAFVLAEIFAKKEDLVRTGLGPSRA